jgi:uncharacterized membrane protein
VNVFLWVLQVLLALAFVAVGLNHAFRAEAMKAQRGMAWIGAVPRGLMTAIGLLEVLGGLGLLLPALTGILPWLTPLAAAGLVTIMALAVVFHAARPGESRNIVMNVILLVLAAVVAYGRWVVAPL